MSSSYTIPTNEIISTDQHFQIRHGTSTSNIALINARVPQGCVLSPIVFNIYASDQPTTQNTLVALI